MSDLPVRPELFPRRENLRIETIPEDAAPVINGVNLGRAVQRLARVPYLDRLNWDNVIIRFRTHEESGRNLGWAVEGKDQDGDGDKDKLVVVANRPRDTKRSVFETLIHELAHCVTSGHGQAHAEASLRIAFEAGVLDAQEYVDGIAKVTAVEKSGAKSQKADTIIGKAAVSKGIIQWLSVPDLDAPVDRDEEVRVACDKD